MITNKYQKVINNLQRKTNYIYIIYVILTSSHSYISSPNSGDCLDN